MTWGDRVARAASVACLVLGGVAATEGRLWTALAEVLLAVLLWWPGSRRPPPRRPVPAHVDVDWARRVLEVAGSPQGVEAVRTLRRAEPALGLLEAKQLADATVTEPPPTRT